MCDFVIGYGLAERTRKVVTVLSPNIVGVRAAHSNCLAQRCSLAVPFNDDGGTLVSHFLDFFNVLVYHT
jgi:hypothetical protein